MLQFFVADYNFIFLLSFVLAVGIAAFEGIAQLLGYSLARVVEDIMPMSNDAQRYAGNRNKRVSLSGWLCLDRLPVLVWATLWLLGFSLGGMSFNFILSLSLALEPSFLLSIPVSVLMALSVCRISAPYLSRKLPHANTFHEEHTALNGLVAKVVDSIATTQRPAKAVCRDQFGYQHTVLVMPVEHGVQIKPGELVVLVEERQSVWLAVALSS